MDQDQRTEILQFRVTPQERALIEKWAKKESITVSQYVRVSVLMDLAISGDVEAMKIIFSALGKAAKASIQRRFSKVLGEAKA